jgi:hypothetical protein
MKQVDKEYFNKTVLKLDVVLSVKGSFPFTTEFKLRSGALVGVEVERYGIGDEDRIVEEYYTDL